MDISDILKQTNEAHLREFEEGKRIKSFDEYLKAFTESAPALSRSAPAYVADMFDQFGSEESPHFGRTIRRYKIFNPEFSDGRLAVYGHEPAQNEMYNQIRSFAQHGKADRLIMLHGPNGSAKTSLIECVIEGLTQYSRLPEGTLFRFNWIFTERGASSSSGMGFGNESADATGSLAHAPESIISSRIVCELRDHPMFLVPPEHRKAFLESLLDEAGVTDESDRARVLSPFLLDGRLCPKCNKIFNGLMIASGGDWLQVMRHVQVERYFISKRYRSGVATIEPQGSVDATSKPMEYGRGVELPPMLQNLNIFEPFGDLVDANGGVVEYSDFLKRPLEANKYLLTTGEKGLLNLANFTAYLNLVMLGTSNEKHLTAFKAYPDFTSFKARIELVPVPYLVEFSKEQRIYEAYLDSQEGAFHVAPRTAEVAALWAVLTRLRRPLSSHYQGDVASIIRKISPLQKALLYDRGELPGELTREERAVLRGNISAVAHEFDDSVAEFEGVPGAGYEGRRGASAREIKTLLSDAAARAPGRCLTPMRLFAQMQDLLNDRSVFDFLRLTADEGYNDNRTFIRTVQEYYLEMVEEEVAASIGLIDSDEYLRLFEEYFQHVRAYSTGEKVANPTTGEFAPASEQLMKTVEDHFKLNEPPESFRGGLMTKVAAYSLDNPGKELDYREIYPELFESLRDSFYEERRGSIQAVEQNLLRYGTDDFKLLSKQDQAYVERAMDSMRERGYCNDCAREVIAFVLNQSREKK